MSVRKSERKPSKLRVQIVAEEIAKYTIQKTGNQKVIAKRNYQKIGKPMVDKAIEMCQMIDTANEYDLNDIDEAVERLKCQKIAFSLSKGLMALVDIASGLKGIDKTYQHWSELVSEEQKLLKGWMQSDRRRKCPKDS